MTATTTPTRRRGPSTVRHPHRDPETGLVPEEHAAGRDGWEGTSWGDGKSIVDITAEVSEYLPSLYVVAWVRPTSSQAPRDSGGRPMTGWVHQGARQRFELDTDGVAAAVMWLVDMGITPSYASKVVEAAVTKSDRKHARDARIAGILAEVGQQAGAARVVLEELIADRRNSGRASVRALLAAYLDQNADDADILRTRLAAAATKR